MHTSVFIIDDEAELAQYTAKYFNMSGVKTEYALDAESALAWLEENTVSLILLDINLGDQSGFDLCQKLRAETDVPILFISARSSEDDMMLALNIGGDDYVCKPYSLGVLLAKVKAILKRYENSKTAGEKVSETACARVPKDAPPELQDAPCDDLVHFGNITVDMKSGMVIRKSPVAAQTPDICGASAGTGNASQNASGTSEEDLNGKDSGVRLKAMEYKILSYLLKNKNRIISKDEFFENVWETEFVGDVTLNVHIRHLREKLEENPKEPRFVKTVWGVGFILEMPK